jgi:hypothetical protein
MSLARLGVACKLEPRTGSRPNSTGGFVPGHDPQPGSAGPGISDARGAKHRDYQGKIGATGFEPATFRPPAEPIQVSMCLGASVVSYVSSAVDDLDTSDHASGTKPVPRVLGRRVLLCMESGTFRRGERSRYGAALLLALRCDRLGQPDDLVLETLSRSARGHFSVA